MGLEKIKKSGLSGQFKFKTWLFWHSLLSRLLWLFRVYEFSSVGLYIRSRKLQLPPVISHGRIQVAKCRVLLSLRDYNDDLVKKCHNHIWAQVGSQHSHRAGREFSECVRHHWQPLRWAARHTSSCGEKQVQGTGETRSRQK